MRALLALLILAGSAHAQVSPGANACLNWLVGCTGGSCTSTVGLPPALCPTVAPICPEPAELTLATRNMQLPWAGIVQPGMTQPLSFNNVSITKFNFKSLNFEQGRMWVSTCPGTNRREVAASCSTGSAPSPNLELNIAACIPLNDNKVYYLNVQNQTPNQNEVQINR